ncbi:MAG: PTS fructose transporter subunit IIA [Candidatus Schekmanbacteria bacterium]|nr:PTS fructose transporter subunit IIA [Candidatus Schekmanbacteria bacterium]
MVGVVIVTHGKLAEELLKTAELIVGHQPQMKTFSVSTLADDASVYEQLRIAVKEVNTGQGVFILTDMFGGTPSNLSLPLLDEPGVEVITGVNLPMVVKLADPLLKQDMEELKNLIVEYGKRSILSASDLLKTRK